MSFKVSFVVLCGLVLAGCPDKKSDAPPAPAPAASAVASAAPSAAASVDVSGLSGKMAHCPNAVQGANTVFTDVPGGVELLVTVKGDDAVKDLRARAKFLADSAKDTSPTVKHTGKGEGGGVFGRCPVVMKNTSVDAVDVDTGSKITVKPKDPAELDWLRRESRERNADLAEPGGATAGVGKMQHCPSAVDGATTVVKDTKDGLDVLVTAKGDPAVKDIRDRAKHLVDAAKLDPAAVQHNGEGGGGGGLGRCPVVLQDTLITAKDIEGGAQVSVKPKKASDAVALRKEAHERADNFVGATK